jgi:Calcineurin-like phosphoesterase
MRIVQFSDTHISHLRGVGYGNAERLVDYLNEVAAPDLAINTGDVVILDPDSADDRDAAMRIHERIQAPLRVLPGNHDVGECALDPWRGLGVTSERVQGFRSAWGGDRFVLFGDAAQDAQDWAFVGINSELCGSGLPEARERILGTFHGGDLRVIANGHVHRYRCLPADDVMTVWAPSLAFATEAEPELKFGPGTAGIVEYLIQGPRVDARFVKVPGIEGAADFFALPEARQSLAALERRSV